MSWWVPKKCRKPSNIEGNQPFFGLNVGMSKHGGYPKHCSWIRSRRNLTINHQTYWIRPIVLRSLFNYIFSKNEWFAKPEATSILKSWLNQDQKKNWVQKVTESGDTIPIHSRVSSDFRKHRALGQWDFRTKWSYCTFSKAIFSCENWSLKNRPSGRRLHFRGAIFLCRSHWAWSVWSVGFASFQFQWLPRKHGRLWSSRGCVSAWVEFSNMGDL